MGLFLKPLAMSLKKLFVEGTYTYTCIHMYNYDQNYTNLAPLTHSIFEFYVGILLSTPVGECVVRVALVCATLDLPARAAVLNVIQYNGFWGCCRCLQKG